ncbi:unnamed protein product [Peronospora belbahrii]|uniref:Uncharacterized protein n=1 Tax=Peronospora belbahrii TaxID=622444 RepID=A0ABN8CY26_9STRA|nr:unnamed protein product [Peronospora belbahrii]
MILLDGSKVMLDEVFVMGKTVLYVHIPDRINISQHLQHYTQMLRQSATIRDLLVVKAPRFRRIVAATVVVVAKASEWLEAESSIVFEQPHN